MLRLLYKNGKSYVKPKRCNKCWVFSIAILFLVAAHKFAVADFTIGRSGSADPTTQGFTVSYYQPNATVEPVADMGHSAWSIADNARSSQYGYSASLSAANSADLVNHGFDMMFGARVLAGTALPYDATNHIVIAGAQVGANGRRFEVDLGVNSSGDTVVVLPTSIDSNGPGESIRAPGPSYTLVGSGSTWHNYDLEYYPTTHLANLFVDGVLRLQDYPGHTSFVSSVFDFSAFSGGQGNFDLVRLASPAVPNSHVLTPRLRMVALQGQPAPGTGVGVDFGSFGGSAGLGGNILVIGATNPQLNNAGQVAFAPFPGPLTGPGVDSTNDSGIWSERSGSLKLVVREGTQAPGTPSGVNFHTLSTAALSVNDAGQATFKASLTGSGVDDTNEHGFWSERFGTLGLIAREGDYAPGTPDGVSFDGFNRLVVNDASQIAFTSGLVGGDVNFDTSRGIWSERGGTLGLVARKGDHAPGTPEGVTFNSFEEAENEPAIDQAGHTAFYAKVSGPSVNVHNDSGIWSDRSGIVSPVVLEGDPAPGFPDGVKFDGLSQPYVNATGQLAFLSSVDNLETLWSERTGSMQVVARQGTHAPGMPANVNFAIFHFDALNNAGQTAFIADVAEATNIVGKGVWSDASGILSKVAGSGDAAPGTPTGVTFSSFDVPSLNDSGQVAFDAVLTGSGIDSGNNLGIWATDINGILRLIVREGDAIQVAPDDVRTISNLLSPFGCCFHREDFNNLGQITFFAEFTDGTSGLFLSYLVMPGDYNDDGFVNALDYAAWRATYGNSVDPGTGADGNGDGIVNAADYVLWRKFLREQAGMGDTRATAVPEPSTFTVVIGGYAALLLVVRTRNGVKN